MLIIQSEGKINLSVYTLVSNHPIQIQPYNDNRLALYVVNLDEKDGKDVNQNKKDDNAYKQMSVSS